jgi:predicted ribonuclease YlaK
MKRASQVFKGSDIYGEVTLKNIHRSKIAMLAENM